MASALGRLWRRLWPRRPRAPLVGSLDAEDLQVLQWVIEMTRARRAAEIEPGSAAEAAWLREHSLRPQLTAEQKQEQPDAQ